MTHFHKSNGRAQSRRLTSQTPERRRIGILHAAELTFPQALIDRIAARAVPGVAANPVRMDAVRLASECEYRVLIDRASHTIPFYRSYVKNAALRGTIVIDNPFAGAAADAFSGAALAGSVGVPVPRAVALPQKMPPPGATDRSFGNLAYPLNWEEAFAFVGFPAYLKPVRAEAGRPAVRVESRAEFFRAYDATGSACMMLQQAIEAAEYYRCYVAGAGRVRSVRHHPDRPAQYRYDRSPADGSRAPLETMEAAALRISGALGFDVNMVEFAVRDGVAWAIRCLDPAPEADYHIVGLGHFEWFVNAMADLAIGKAIGGESGNEVHGRVFPHLADQSPAGV